MKNSWLCFLTCVVILLTLSSNLLAEEDIVSSVMPHNIILQTRTGELVNFNSLNSGFTALTFINPDSKMSRDLQKWLNEINEVENIKLYSITTKNSKALEKMQKDIENNIPILIDDDNILGQIFQIKKFPKIIVFKDGYMISKKDWSIKNDKKELAEYFTNISEGGFSSPEDETIRLSGNHFPNISAKLMDGKSFNSWEVENPVVFALLNVKSQDCNKFLEGLISLNSEVNLPNIFLIFNNQEDIVISNELVKKASQINKFHLIIDSSQEIKNTLETSMCIEFKTYPSYMICGPSNFITWAKIGYNPNYFKKSLMSILEVIYKGNH